MFIQRCRNVGFLDKISIQAPVVLIAYIAIAIEATNVIDPGIGLFL